jgi:hypothetical protein
MCGGDIAAAEGQNWGTCDSCGTTMTLPTASDERRVNLFNRANHFRRLNEFDKALIAYENILNEDHEDAEAHWGAVLCRYGIEYVEDPRTHDMLPTCHRAQYESILVDADYLAALEYAPDYTTAQLYEKEAAAINELQKGILLVSREEKPYDIFICYKEATPAGTRTKDSALAQDIYYQMEQAGYRTFFARISLEDKVGREYEPYIFSALHSAKVMLVIGTKPEYFTAVWVKNEWSRFLALAKKDKSRLLIPCYKDMDAYDLPEELSFLQSQDMSKIGFVQDLLRGVKKVLEAAKPEPTAGQTAPAQRAHAAPTVESLYKRGLLFLEDLDFEQADEYFDKALDIHPEWAPAYMGKFFVDNKMAGEAAFLTYVEGLAAAAKENKTPVDLSFMTENANFKRMMRFADERLRGEYQGYVERLKRQNEAVAEQIAQEQERQRAERERLRAERERAEAERARDLEEQRRQREQERAEQRRQTELAIEERKREQYAETLKLSQHARKQKDLNKVARMFHELRDYQDAPAYAKRYTALANKAELLQIAIVVAFLVIVIGSVFLIVRAQNDRAYQNAAGLYDAGQYEEAAAAFAALEDYSDSAERVLQAKDAALVSAYDAAATLYKAGQYREAEAAFAALGDYKDSKDRAAQSNLQTQYDAAVALYDSGEYEQAIAAFVKLGGYQDSNAKIGQAQENILSSKYSIAVGLYDAGQYAEAGIAFAALGNYKDSKDRAAQSNLQTQYNTAVALYDSGEYEQAIAAFVKLGDYQDSKAKKAQAETIVLEPKYSIAVGLCDAGQYAEAWRAFAALGDYNDSQEKLNTILQLLMSESANSIAAGIDFTVGVKADGTVVAVGDNDDGQCDVDGWSDIVSVAAGGWHTVGLKADGTVVAVGDSDSGQCDIDGWSNIVAIAAGYAHTVGLKADGTVVATGGQYGGRCDVDGWSDIVSIAAGGWHTVGLKADGTVVAVGENDDGECDVDGWNDIVYIAVGDGRTAGVKTDGTVVVAGKYYARQSDIEKWSDIVSVATGLFHAVGLKADRTVVAVGESIYGWSNIVSIAAGSSHTVGLKADGTVVAVSLFSLDALNVSSWRNIKLPTPQ